MYIYIIASIKFNIFEPLLPVKVPGHFNHHSFIPKTKTHYPFIYVGFILGYFLNYPTSSMIIYRLKSKDLLAFMKNIMC